jgi:quinolinate synthase
MLRFAESADQGPTNEPAAQVSEPGLEQSAEPTTAEEPGRIREAVVATETGMLYPLRMAAPHIDFIPANPVAECVYMKMITLPKLRDSLRDMKFEVRVPEDIAERARLPIDRMVAIG